MTRAIALAALLVLALHGRLEMFLLTPWVFVRIAASPGDHTHSEGGASWEETRPQRFMWVLVIATIGALLPIAWLFVDGVQHDVYGWTDGAATRIEHLQTHLPGNLAFLFHPTTGAPLVTSWAGSRRCTPSSSTCCTWPGR